MTNVDFKGFLSLVFIVPCFVIASRFPELSARAPFFWPCSLASYCSALLAVWADATSWRRRIASVCAGGAIAIVMGLIAATIVGSTIYGAVTFVYSAIPVSVAATQVILGRFDKEGDDRDRRRDYAVLLAYVVLFAGLLFATPPYLMFPWLLGIGAICASAYALVRPVDIDFIGSWRVTVVVVSLFIAYLAMRAISTTTQWLYLDLLK